MGQGAAALRIACGACALWCGQAGAYAVGGAGIEGSFDTTLTQASLVRVERRDPGLIGIANGGTARNVNEDDGDLNYNRGDVVSSLLRVGEEVELRYRNLAFFARGSYFYDAQAARNGDKFGPEGRARLKDRAQLLDLFVSGNFDLGAHHLNLRLGSQVMNWGESTFIAGGLSLINPVDVGMLRQPGSQVKDALLPTPALQASLDLTSGLSLSGFALAAFNRTVLDPRGAYFSTTDIASDDGERLILASGRRSDGHRPPIGAADASVSIGRNGDRRPQGFGQYGVALREIAPALGDTELGLYYLRYDSHAPLLSMRKQDGAMPGSGSSAGDGSAHYFLEYPSRIDIFGASFNTLLPYGIALQGEYSFRPNLPVQLPGTDLVLSALGLPSEVAPAPATIATGTEIQGYRRVGAHQLQFTATRTFAQPGLGASELLLTTEVGANELDLPDTLKFAGPGVSLPSRPQEAVYANGSYQHTGFTTDFSWGYRMAGELRYPGLAGALTFTPRLVYSDDVQGVGPNFNQGTQAVALNLGFDYLVSWHAEAGYTSFFGGRNYSGTDTTAVPGQPLSYSTSANPLRDRDFVTLSFSYSF
ncbi:MAG: DUF1302 domain-containing protein [Nevskiales bacterium]